MGWWVGVGVAAFPSLSKSQPKHLSRFNRIAWGLLQENSKHPRGILAGGMENGGLEMWDPRIIIDGGGKDASIMRQSAHRGPVRGLDFNPIQGNLLASGATEGEVKASKCVLWRIYPIDFSRLKDIYLGYDKAIHTLLPWSPIIKTRRHYSTSMEPTSPPHSS